MLADYHMHTSFSDDSTYPMEDEIKKAISLGIDEICFTEHVDYGVKVDINCDYIAYINEFNRCREKYKDKITMKLGIEFGMQEHTIDEFQKDFNEYDFDFVILSCHQVDNKAFWTQDFQKGKTQKEYNEKYYEEILKVIKKYNDYSVLGHLDMINRYDKIGKYPFKKVRDIVKEILAHAISQGKGIEINTSCFRYGLDDLTPSREILKLYRELGGTIITIGSDSHKEDDVGCKISYVKNELKELGYKEFCTYKKMEPIFHCL
ncbi:histidinol-phosphatase HisJ family protein [Clostridium beijerinckii]|uniref:histidinol-phosphatase HisJ family protein n=1 Tax=Clostridium beijerinckii TaxID=1520 RepID=UPI00098CA612|nr:histidinol-phosphatase HisJ family protein [Clostridium beijerinckii]MBA8936552.1 histidinol-phosphatase (PHP family) [Clostridium beijerinckii]NRT33314.1 histidinol-phosphatase (PHP family) [Clostridium beijerinckii]NRT47260.1 histidinol-phosphatase (PHP family) [Clostridium beijerinckii]NRU40980.1 histidinol-phosphatase (PHP family) [Clostridium beijerinckii]NRZ18735.1 histidinol-phosphatase (PHP family) [Clostridium beijerinckii]